MKKIYRDAIYFMFLPLVAGAFYWEAKQKFSPADHSLVQITIVILFCGLALAWNQYDEVCKLRELTIQKPVDGKQSCDLNRELIPASAGQKNTLAAENDFVGDRQMDDRRDENFGNPLPYSSFPGNNSKNWGDRWKLK